MVQTVFLISIFMCIGLWVLAVLISRMNWRPDIEPYTRRTRSFDLLIHPKKYVLQRAVSAVRLLVAIGMLFLLIAIGSLVFQFIRDFSSR